MAGLDLTDASTPTVSPDTVGVYVLSVRASDSEGASSSADYITVTVGAGTEPPIADCGGNVTAVINDRVELSGHESEDPEDSELTYEWALDQLGHARKIGVDGHQHDALGHRRAATHAERRANRAMPSRATEGLCGGAAVATFVGMKPGISAPTAMIAALVAALGGMAAGIGMFTFVYAKGGSYMTDDPAACANCHVMQEQYDGWVHGSHRSVAVCNDCHTPEGFLSKYLTKALNGWHHSRAFTTQDFHEPIVVTPRNAAITEARCRSCHGTLASMIEGPHAGGEAIACARCHRDVGHLH